jgi:uncharacterized protein (DUF58 family)
LTGWLNQEERTMKPAYWILILALFGAIVGAAMYSFAGWLGIVVGVILGVIAGLIIFAIKAPKTK